MAQPFLIPQAGLNLSEFAFNNDEFITRSEVGYQFGFLGRFGKNAFLQTGVLYSQMNNTFTLEDTTGFYNGKVTVNGLFIPAQLGFNIYNADIIKIRLLAGINMSIPLEVKDESSYLSKSDFTGMSTGAAVGFGVDIFRFVLDANFSFGISDMIELGDINSHLNLYTLSIGYLIGNSY